MEATIVSIGNSRGIRIPKPILEQCHIEKNVILEVEENNIIIRPIRKEPRRDWELAFRKMGENKDDQLIIDDRIDLDVEDWKW